MADFHQHLMQFFSFCQTQTDTAVARKCTGTGQDKVADTGKPHHGFGLRTHGHGKTGDFGETARHQCRTRIESVFETVGKTGGDCHNVFDGTADSHADNVRTAVKAHYVGVELRHQFLNPFLIF